MTAFGLTKFAGDSQDASGSIIVVRRLPQNGLAAVVLSGAEQDGSGVDLGWCNRTDIFLFNRRRRGQNLTALVFATELLQFGELRMKFLFVVRYIIEDAETGIIRKVGGGGC